MNNPGPFLRRALGRLLFGYALFPLLTGSTAGVTAAGNFPQGGPSPIQIDRFALPAASRLSVPKGRFKYYGGPVMSHVRVVVVFWGSGVSTVVSENIGNFFNHLTNSDLMDFLDQYNTLTVSQDGRAGTKQHIGRGSYAGTVTIMPANTNILVDDSEIQRELKEQIDSGKLPKPDANTLFMIYFPPEITVTMQGSQSCNTFCSYHGGIADPKAGHIAYGVVPDLGGACAQTCGDGSALNALTTTSSHEFVEAVTDPLQDQNLAPTPGYPQSWSTVNGQELADLCSGKNNVMKLSDGKTVLIQSLFDNASDACTDRTWSARKKRGHDPGSRGVTRSAPMPQHSKCAPDGMPAFI